MLLAVGWLSASYKDAMFIAGMGMRGATQKGSYKPLLGTVSINIEPLWGWSCTTKDATPCSAPSPYQDGPQRQQHWYWFHSLYLQVYFLLHLQKSKKAASWH